MNLLIFYLALAIWVVYTIYCIWRCEKEKRKLGDWSKAYVKKVLKPLLKDEKSVSQRVPMGLTHRESNFSTDSRPYEKEFKQGRRGGGDVHILDCAWSYWRSKE